MPAGGKLPHLAHRVVAADLRNSEPVGIAIGKRPNPFEKQRDVGVRLVVDFLLEIEGPRPDLVRGRRRRIVAKFGIVHREIDRVDTKAVDPPVEPELHDVEQGLLHVGVMPVELRLRA